MPQTLRPIRSEPLRQRVSVSSSRMDGSARAARETYYATVDGRSGQFEIYVDGEAVRTIDADFSGGWGNAIKGMEVYTSDEAAEHTVTIRKAADSAGDVFDLLGFLTS